MEGSQKFRREERLSSRKAIQRLFESGKSFGYYPFRLIWKENLSVNDPMARIVISVPKKRFKRAVDRNLIRRRLKEIYRKKKPEFYEKLVSINRKIDFIMIYVGDKDIEFNELDRKISALLLRFEWEIMNQK
jgi:ribonuclease P protein component